MATCTTAGWAPAFGVGAMLHSAPPRRCRANDARVRAWIGARLKKSAPLRLGAFQVLLRRRDVIHNTRRHRHVKSVQA